MVAMLTGCQNANDKLLAFPTEDNNFTLIESNDIKTADLFAKDLCVVPLKQKRINILLHYLH